MTRRIKDYSLHIYCQLGRTSWALAADVDGTTAVVVKHGTLDRDDDLAMRTAVLLTVIDTLRATEPASTEIDLFVFDTAARKMLLDLGGMFGTIRVLTKSQMNHIEGWDRFGWRRCRELLGSAERPAPSANRTIDAATDGSVARSGGASFAWIRDDGRFNMRTLDTSDILIAELSAIFSLLSDAEPEDRLRISVDSQAAIQCVSFEVGAGRTVQSNRVEALLRDIRALSTRRAPFELVWVKAHNGHPLNDGADRLARLARQSADVVTTRVQGTVARNIVEDALSNHREMLASA